MNDKTTSPQGSSNDDKAPGFRIQRVYLKDLSLEQPHAPEIL